MLRYILLRDNKTKPDQIMLYSYDLYIKHSVQCHNIGINIGKFLHWTFAT